MKKIYEKYSILPLPMKAAMWFSVCTFLNRGISIFTTPLFTRLLPLNEYGRLSVISSWESIVMILITLSSAKPTGNLCVKYEEKSWILSVMTGLNITLGVCFGLFLLLFIKPIIAFTGLSKLLILFIYFQCFFQYIITCWVYIRQFEFSYKVVVIESIGLTVMSSFSGLVAVVFFCRTAEARFIPQVISVVLIGSIILINIFRRSHVFYNGAVWKFILCFSVPLLPHYFSEIILMNSDRIMIDRMCGSSDAAIYGFAYTVGSLINMLSSSVNSAFIPYQYYKIKERNYAVLAKNTNFIIGIVSLGLCVVMLLGREIILIFGGQKYIDSIKLIIPISLGVYFNYVFQLFARVQEYFEQKYTIVIASVGCALLNIVLNFIFIRKYGYQAAAYTTFFCYLVFCVIHYLFYRLACKRNIGCEIYDVKGLVLISVCLIVAAIFIYLIRDMLILKYILLALILAIVVWKRFTIFKFINMIRKKG